LAPGGYLVVDGASSFGAPWSTAMATIVILEHRLQSSARAPYLIYLLAGEWRSAGHRVLIHQGAENPPPGDIAVLHVDLTVVPDDYSALTALYPRVINGSVLNIGKSTFSQCVLTRDADWDGSAIVKTEANFGGVPERSLKATDGPVLQDYPIYPSPRHVPDDVWNTAGLLVEKFVPEMDERGYYLRVWTFFGDRERSTRYRAVAPLIKLGNVLGHEETPVPDELRAWREKLGFDYGKFDYICPYGQPVLLDVNKTPVAAVTPENNPSLHASFRSLAGGLRSLSSGA
jgi:hypothetical protein